MKLLAAVGGVALVACSKAPAPAPAPSSSAATTVAAPSSPLLVESAPAPPSPPPTCRALRVVGDAKVGAISLQSGTVLDGSEWVELAAGSSFTLKHAASGRELSVAGPALVRPCRRGREQLLVARGTVRGGGGVGVRPGAEVLIATPVAAVRYADAELEVALTEKQLRVEVRAGEAEVDSATDRAIESPLRAKQKVMVPVRKPDPKSLMARCRAAAERAVETGRKLGDTSAPEPLGERASAHVKARRAARSTCTIAAAAIGLVADPAESAGLWADAVRWEGLWETVPRPLRANPAEK